jgi:hypothetical protein
MGRYQQEFQRSLTQPVPPTIEDPAALDALRPLLYGD